MSVFRYDTEVDICCAVESFVANIKNRQIRVKSPLKSLRNIDAESMRVVDFRNKHLRGLADCDRQPPFQPELLPPRIKVHERWYPANGTGVDPCKCTHHVPVYITCQTHYNHKNLSMAQYVHIRVLIMERHCMYPSGKGPTYSAPIC